MEKVIDKRAEIIQLIERTLQRPQDTMSVSKLYNWLGSEWHHKLLRDSEHDVILDCVAEGLGLKFKLFLEDLQDYRKHSSSLNEPLPLSGWESLLHSWKTREIEFPRPLQKERLKSYVNELADLNNTLKDVNLDGSQYIISKTTDGLYQVKDKDTGEILYQTTDEAELVAYLQGKSSNTNTDTDKATGSNEPKPEPNQITEQELLEGKAITGLIDAVLKRRIKLAFNLPDNVAISGVYGNKAYWIAAGTYPEDKQSYYTVSKDGKAIKLDSYDKLKSYIIQRMKQYGVIPSDKPKK